MQAYTSPRALHKAMWELALLFQENGHDFYAGALSSFCFQFQKDTGFEIEPYDFEVNDGPTP